MKQIIADQDLVFLGDDSFQVDCSPVRQQGFVFIGDDGEEFWAEAKPFEGRVYEFDPGPSEAIFLEAQQIADTPPDPGPIYKRRFSPLEYLDRFTEDEQLAVVAATMTNPAVKLWYDRMLAASFINLDDPRTEAGIDALIDAELIESSRKAALMEPGTYPVEE